ncbi:hypothetical protein BDY21DRAFT_340861 [Lineolata rhizophorae]|uniref:Fe2OG dioxygenase domain-containing protein n=1 Tax=Lineolata rhizophorae TaxID=578093 RepID=A0A6A6P4D2_9PEZI|nr:hypothetical protein BDY21DRAFT_340861 [Lineolata rhizophorae]
MPPKGKRKDASAANKTGPAGSKGTAQPPKSPPPNWPPLRPLVPASDLSLSTTLPNQIVTIRNFWPASLCKMYVSFLASLPLTTTPGKPKKGDAVRVNDRFQVEDARFAEMLWEETALKGLVVGEEDGFGVGEDDGLALSEEERRELWGGDVVGLNPNIRIYRYKKGQFFDQHYDDFNNVTIPGDPPIQARTTWTLLLYLTSPATGCLGGETVFYPEPPPGKKGKSQPVEPVVVGLEVGMALLHRHGAECMLHEGREVLEGEKWVIRSDLCVRR